jgi:hypothetical protein
LKSNGAIFCINLPVTALLAFPGVAIAAAVVAIGMHWLLGWSWMGAGLFGARLAATDPVSVLATFKEVKLQPRLALLVESESLLNDGAAAVTFAILVGLLAAPAQRLALLLHPLSGSSREALQSGRPSRRCPLSSPAGPRITSWSLCRVDRLHQGNNSY